MLPLTEAEQQVVVFPLEMVTGCMEAVGGHAEAWPGERDPPRGCSRLRPERVLLLVTTSQMCTPETEVGVEALP